MKKQKNKNNFFGLNTSEKAKIVREAADLATKEQITIVNKYGGVKALKSYSN